MRQRNDETAFGVEEAERRVGDAQSEKRGMTIPCRPRMTIQANVLTTTLVSSGNKMINVSTAWTLRRHRTYRTAKG